MTRATLSPSQTTQVHPNGTPLVDVLIVSIVPVMLMLDLAGYFIDRQLGTSPSFLLVGYGLGLCIVLYAVNTTHRSSMRRP